MRREKTIGYIAFNKEKGYVTVCIFNSDGSKIYGHVDPEDLLNVARGGAAYAKIKAWR